MLKALLVLPLAMLSACATISNGTTEVVNVETIPANAYCTVDRGTEQLAVIPSTPGRIRVRRSAQELSVTCAKRGYVSTTVDQRAHFNGTIFGNLLIGGVIGVAVDLATRANTSYPRTITLDLPPNPAPGYPPLSYAPDGAPVIPASARSGMEPGRRAPR